MKHAIRGIASLTILVALASLFGLLYLDDNQLSELLGFDVQYCKIILDGNGGIVEFSLVEKLPTIVIGAILIIALMILVLVKVDFVVHLLKAGCRFLGNYAKTTWSMIWGSHVKYLLLGPTIAAVYSAYALPVTFDEALTYYDFVKPSFWYGIAFYPYPNNHVFFSLLGNIINEFSFIDLLFRLRIPAMLANLLTWILAYRFVKKYYTENVALFVVGLGMVITSTFFYGFLARGYVLVVLFLVVILYAAFNIVYDGNKRRDWIFFTLGGILGAYSVPSFLYPFATVSVFIFIYNYKNLRTQIFYSVLVGLGAVILYFPVLVVGGVEALAQNGYVLPIPRMEVAMALPGYFKGVVVNVFHVSPYVIGISLLLVIGYVLYKRDKKTILWWALFCSAPFILLLLHAVIPFFRVFNYYGFILVFLVGISLKDLLASLKKEILLIGVLILQAACLANFFVHKGDILLEVSASDEIVEELLEDNKKYFFHSGIESALVEGNIKFEGERRGLNVETRVDWMTTVDNAAEDYDYYLVLKAHDHTEACKPWKTMVGPFGKPINIYNRDSVKKKE